MIGCYMKPTIYAYFHYPMKYHNLDLAPLGRLKFVSADTEAKALMKLISYDYSAVRDIFELDGGQLQQAGFFDHPPYCIECLECNNIHDKAMASPDDVVHFCSSHRPSDEQHLGMVCDLFSVGEMLAMIRDNINFDFDDYGGLLRFVKLDWETTFRCSDISDIDKCNEPTLWLYADSRVNPPYPLDKHSFDVYEHQSETEADVYSLVIENNQEVFEEALQHYRLINGAEAEHCVETFEDLIKDNISEGICKFIKVKWY